jgi:hypothetical protein
MKASPLRWPINGELTALIRCVYYTHSLIVRWETEVTTAKLVQRIEEMQTIQKRNPPTSEVWQLASATLDLLFAEMANRQAANGSELNWRKWTA